MAKQVTIPCVKVLTLGCAGVGELYGAGESYNQRMGLEPTPLPCGSLQREPRLWPSHVLVWEPAPAPEATCT